VESQLGHSVATAMAGTAERFLPDRFYRLPVFGPISGIPPFPTNSRKIRMSSTWSPVAAAFVLLASASLGPLLAQTPGDRPQTFRASADVVTIQASVRDARGRVLSGLTPADFEIRDNGELRQILSL
jgi:hypothetical protein